MRFEELLNVVMVADHVEVKQAMIRRKDQADGKPKPAFVEAPPQGAGAASAMRMRIAEGLTHRLNQVANLFPIRLSKTAQGSQQAGIELNL
ncbi:MAG: hypothetical protein ABIP20_08235 [Chthoniobacteraceae bacterium]